MYGNYIGRVGIDRIRALLYHVLHGREKETSGILFHGNRELPLRGSEIRGKSVEYSADYQAGQAGVRGG